jgi:DNA-binding transcriptional LysR family regulator
MPFDWNDLKYFLAVARKGSTTAAAAVLDASPSTVSRRITALEEALGHRLFERTPEGYKLTPLAESLVPAAERVETAAEVVADRVSAAGRHISGVVRVTTLDVFASVVVMPALAELRTIEPDLRVEVLTGDEVLDLVTGEADVAIRFGPRPTQPGLVIRNIGRAEVALYCSRAYAAAHGVPASVADLDNHAVIRGIDRVDTRPHHLWLAEVAPRAKVAHRSNTFFGVLDAVRQGLGIGSLPTIPQVTSELVRIDVGPRFIADAWLVSSEHSRTQPAVRAFLDFLGPWAIAKLLEGASAD